MEINNIPGAGLQSFHLMDTVWVYGCRYANSGSLPSYKVPYMVSANLSLDYTNITGPPLSSSPRQPNAPSISNGFIWSNLVDRAWLFGGKPLNESETPNNDVWRIETSQLGLNWTLLASNTSISSVRPSFGAGCNVPDLQRGYYLGGSIHDTGNETSSVGSVSYLHSITIFDMQNESLSTVPVPHHVPVINQTLVFLNTATRSGALVAFGGYTESNGNLTLADMSVIHLFDIESQQWVQQTVTDVHGNYFNSTKQAKGAAFDNNATFPSPRGSTCAAAGASLDRTSQNIFMIGGELDAKILSDKWVLTLPRYPTYPGISSDGFNFTNWVQLNSAVWIKIENNSDTEPLYPVAETTCTLINSRFLTLLSNCIIDDISRVASISNSTWPFQYDISDLRVPEIYRYLSVGYFVPLQISSIIGGDLIGHANHSQPENTGFADPLVKDLLTPPYGTSQGDDPFFYEKWVLVSVVFLLIGPYFLLLLFISAKSLYKYLKQRRRPDRPNQPQSRSWAFSDAYLAFIGATTACLIAMVAYLESRSRQADPLFEHWTGGPVSNGTWTGPEYTTTFIRSATYQRPPRGILSHYFDAGVEGEYSQKNTTIRLGQDVYWTFTYLPMLVAVLYGRMWKALDDEIKRLDIYYRLAQSPKTGKQTFYLNYHSFWAPLSILQAIRYRHWSVAFSSLGMVLATIVIPIFSNYVFYWDVYSGALLTWSGIYSWQVALVDDVWAYRLIGALAAAELCCLVVYLLLRKQRGKVSVDIRGIGGLATLLRLVESGGLDIQGKLADGSTDCHESISLSSFHLAASGDMIRVTSGVNSRTNSASSTWLPLWVYIRKAFIICCHFVTCENKFFPFRRVVFSIWLVALLTLLGFMGHLTAKVNQNAAVELWNFQVPYDPNLLLVTGLFIQSIVDVIDQDVRTLGPFHALAQQYQPPSVLWADYNICLPFWDILTAYRNGHYLVCNTMIASLATTIFTIFLGSLQLSAGSFGSTSFNSDSEAAMASTLLIAFVFAVHANIGYHFSFPEPWKLLVTPTNKVFMMMFLLDSHRFEDDIQEVTNQNTIKKKVERLERLDKRYGLGWFWSEKSEKWRYGIERHHGPNSIRKTRPIPPSS